jgi:hypothetical protein
MSNRIQLEVPVEGQSHWCDSKTRDNKFCRNVVRNDSNHCAAGHKNKIRPISIMSARREPVIADPVQTGGEVSWGGVEDFAVAPLLIAEKPGIETSSGWDHTEAKKHTITERLRERCSAYAGGMTCSERDIPLGDWCERCLAADKIEHMYALLSEGQELTRPLLELAGLNPEGPLYYHCQDWLRKTLNI